MIVFAHILYLAELARHHGISAQALHAIQLIRFHSHPTV
jgi:hypothetical protein